MELYQRMEEDGGVCDHLLLAFRHGGTWAKFKTVLDRNLSGSTVLHQQRSHTNSKASYREFGQGFGVDGGHMKQPPQPTPSLSKASITNRGSHTL